MIDRSLRDHAARMELPELGPPARAVPPTTDVATVAIVTTAGLMRPGEPWAGGDSSFRRYPRDEDGLLVGHVSPNFDRVGVSADLDVAYPARRLHELAVSGEIGAVADHHVSFMGGLRDLTALHEDYAPEAAESLRRDGVDVVILTPMCPVCPRAVAVLAHVLERAGLATVALMSNDVIAERARPPRSLVCNFPLGRPLGVPDDADFQLTVLRRALALLDAREPGVLDVIDVEIADRAEEPFAHPAIDDLVADAGSVQAECASLRDAWTAGWEGRGRSTQVGRNVDVTQIPAAVDRIAALAAGAAWPSLYDREDGLALDVMDLRIYYEEAALAVAGDAPPARTTQAWFHRRTHAGRLIDEAVNAAKRAGADHLLTNVLPALSRRTQPVSGASPGNDRP